MKRHGCSVLVLAMMTMGSALPARAQSTRLPGGTCGTSEATPLVSGTLRGIARPPVRDSLGVLALGAAAAFGGHTADARISDALSGGKTLDRVFQPGAVLGGLPLEAGAAIATASLGHALHRPCVAQLGGDLLRAQLVGSAWAIGIKQATRRARPAGDGFSFPSGHTTTAFASATVLQRHFGWMVGIPAYAAASYVGLSRIEMQRHYLSDVAFGAALGVLAGRTVSVGHGHGLIVGPLANERGGGIGFTWIARHQN